MALANPYPFTNPFAEPGESRASTIRLIRTAIIGIYLIGAAAMIIPRFLDDSGLRPGAEPYDNALIGFMIVFGLFTWANRWLPDWWYLMAAYLGFVLVSMAIALELRPSGFFYVWPALASAFFGQKREVVGAYVVAMVSYTIVLFGFHRSPYMFEWLIDVAALIAVVMVMVYVMKMRAVRLVEELDRRSRTDSLTGIANRADFERALTEQLWNSADRPARCAVIALDLDHFKQINDGYGHQAGDEALREAVRIFGSCLGDRGLLARVGGEEFAVLLADADLAAARLVAEELRLALERDTAGATPPLTVSVGVAASPEAGTAMAEVVRAADRALYAAKETGRNRVVAADEGSERVLRLADETRMLRGDPGAQAALRLAERLDQHRYGDPGRARRVGELSAAIAAELGLPDDEVRRIGLAGTVRDVGMLGVPDELLATAHALTPEERALVERHVQVGTEVLIACGLDDLACWVSAHHERPDGNGYPYGLAGDQIPLPGRIIAAAEAYAAVTRAPGVPPPVAVAELREWSGTQFDEDVVEALVAVLAGRGELRVLRAA